MHLDVHLATKGNVSLYGIRKKTFFHSLFFLKNKIFLHRDEEMHRACDCYDFRRKENPEVPDLSGSRPDVRETWWKEADI